MRKRVLIFCTVLVLILVTVFPTGIVEASNASGTTNIRGEIGATYTLTVPSEVDLGTLTPSGTGFVNVGDIVFSTNDSPVAGTSYVVITVADNEVTVNHGGFMRSVGGQYLSNGLLIQGGILTLHNLPASNATALEIQDSSVKATSGEISNGTWTRTISDLQIKQPIFSENVATSYSATLSFTATYHGN
jgi:hypothetical protein